MDIGITMMGGDVAGAAEMAALAESKGYSSAWTAEFYDRSASISLAVMAERTSEIRLGSAIIYAFGRSPLVLAIEARDLDEVSCGRMTLGLGTLTPGQVTHWLGQDAGHLAPRIEELVPLLRRLLHLEQGPVKHDGRFYHVNVVPMVSVRPLQAEMPIYLAGTSPRMIESAGAVADGLVGHPLFTPEYVSDSVRPALERGLRRAGRDQAVPIAGYVLCSIGDDPLKARRAAAAQLAFYACVKTFDAILLGQHGFRPEIEEIRAAFGRRDLSAMTDAVSDRMIETLAVFGTPVEARQRFFQRYQDLYEQPLLFSPSVGLDPQEQRQNIRAIIETFRPARVRVDASAAALRLAAERGRD
jgi:alkanesulfonate monooxygenase SsuD/methylene tetrahydromethanopterin reductase-like flavin-dependent oxidoreductase (luciferase family)